MNSGSYDNSAASALIVGVGVPRGLGAALGRRFAAEGLQVVLAGRSEEKLAATAAAFAAAGLDVHTELGDATDPDDVERFVASAEARAPLAVAIHNAGQNRPRPFLQLETHEFEEHWRSHCLGGMLLGRAALRRMTPRRHGTIIYTGASGSLRGKATFASFAAAKAGARMLSQSLAREFGPQGIHVAHVIIDGGIDGERFASRVPDMEQRRQSQAVLNVDAIADSYWMLHRQNRSAWTQELDLRPWTEPF